HTRRFPALVAAIAELAPSTLILDGEVCIFDERMISRFEWLRERPTAETATPPERVRTWSYDSDLTVGHGGTSWVGLPAPRKRAHACGSLPVSCLRAGRVARPADRVLGRVPAPTLPRAGGRSQGGPGPGGQGVVGGSA